MARQNLILGLQAFSAIGIFALGLLTFFGQSSRDLRLEMRQGFESIREENGAFRREMREEFGAVKTEIKREFGAFRTEMRGEFGAFRTEMKEELADIRTELRDVNIRLSRVEGHLGMPPVQIPVP